MTENVSKTIDEAFDKELRAQSRPVVVEKKQATVTEQWAMLEKIDRELRDRIRRERQQIISEYDRNVVELENAYSEKIGNTVAMLEQDKKNELSKLAYDTADKLRNHDLLAKRMG